MSEEIVYRNDEAVANLELAIVNNCELLNLEIKHRFTKGMYARAMIVPSREGGTIITSKTHKTNHFFTIAKGDILVSVDGVNWIKVEEGFTGITSAGTRRMGFVPEGFECIWTTFHPLDFITGEEDLWDDADERKIALLEKIESIVVEPYENNLLSDEQKEQVALSWTKENRFVDYKINEL